MDWSIQAAEQAPVSRWSGGQTRQLFIEPPGASYAGRDFLWRVSSATVETDSSVFTPLPDYRRLIATLRGEIVLTHGSGAPVTLRPYEIHAFDGAADTRCEGRCTDFNLMLRKGAAEGTMEALRLDGPARRLRADPRDEALLAYCAEGACTVTDETRRAELRAGDSLRLRGAPALCLAGKGVLLICRMWRTETE